MKKIDLRGNSIRALANPVLQRNLKNATATALKKRAEVIGISETYEKSRDEIIRIRDLAIPRLGELLAEFVENCEKRSIKIHVFNDYGEASKKISEIIKSKGADYIVKSKSMLTEEMGLDAYLEKDGITPIETDLGEFIVQLYKEPPSHLTAPALHRSRGEIAKLFNEKFGMPYDDDPAKLTYFARNYLREKFVNARVGITGANFAVAENASIAVIENEGNARMCLTLPKTHIAVFGVEKLIPKFTDLPPFLDVLSKSATGQILNAYTSIVGEPEAGIERHYIVITKNRFEIAKDPVFREALRCVRCGACQNVCPVFQRISGHGYEFTYGGPIGLVLAPFFIGYQACEGLLDASTLCGFCKSVCPAKINLPHLIIEHRRRFCEEYAGPSSLLKKFKKLFSFGYKTVYSNHFLHGAIMPLMRLYFSASKKLLGYNYVPLWHGFARRHFIDPPKKTFMESYFKDDR